MCGKEQHIEDVLSHMTLHEKIGQCLTLELCGTFEQPYMIRNIEEHHCAGLRTTPDPYTGGPYGGGRARKHS